jgi:carbamoyl-phosphate synthase large subunit
MPKRPDVEKVLVLGSGPIVIGQAAEFDYAGSQACISLREEGISVVLVNSNPATIMTDESMADRVYIEPLTKEFLERIIALERPDSMLATLGGQVGLNLAVELYDSGVLEKYGVQLLGTPITAIRKAEDRQLFKDMLKKIGQPVPESAVVTTYEAALAFAVEFGYPVVIRPAYTLGGTGGGIARDTDELSEIVSRALTMSPIHQTLVEKSVGGWKELEYEVMRDRLGNVITVCNMENLDPMGIHTGDSIVVAPSQTLTQQEYQMLRTASLDIITALGIEGGCNVQFALDTESQKYYVIEVNPRVSRSSALASKATGYPIARISAKIAAGLTLDEIRNPITGKSCACFEPALDYVVLKIPRWPFDKFSSGNRQLGTQMKATGEVMAIGRTFEAALMKAVRSLEAENKGLDKASLHDWETEALIYRLKNADDERLFILAELLRRGVSPREICAISQIDPWFVKKIKNLIDIEETLQQVRPPAGSQPGEEAVKVMLTAKGMGIPDFEIAKLWGMPEDAIAQLRLGAAEPAYMMVDTCAAEFEAITPYYYSVFGEPDEVVDVAGDPPVIVIGSGPIRIGQGIEFDYCCVRGVQAFRREGRRVVVINNNPETVSTDFSISDRLYFEPLGKEDVLDIVRREKPLGVVLQFGGGTAINLARPLSQALVPILGNSMETIDMAEDRDRFDQLMSELDIERPVGGTARSFDDAAGIAQSIGYPVLVRPSYVLGGRAMQVVHDVSELQAYMAGAIRVSQDHPVLVDKYMLGKEIEVDAITDGETVIIPAIMEHIERAGVHSGDSMAFCPARGLSAEVEAEVARKTILMARALKAKGLINAQFVYAQGKVWVIEVNPRASRTVPFVSKVMGIPMVDLAVKVMLGQSLASLGYKTGVLPKPGLTGVKAPVFSWAKLTMVDTALGPEMKSTGEVMGIDQDPKRALYKAMRSAGVSVPSGGHALITVADRDKEEMLPVALGFMKAGLKILATPGTQKFLASHGVEALSVRKLGEGDDILQRILSGEVRVVVNTLTHGEEPRRDGFRIRREAVEHGIPCITSLDTATALAQVVEAQKTWGVPEVYAVQDFQKFERSTPNVAQEKG